MTSLRILTIDTVAKTMVIDWGHTTLNHSIPLYILENPQLTTDQVLACIESLRPDEPIEHEVPAVLLDLQQANAPTLAGI